MTTPGIIAVVGAHLRGQPLHHQLTDRGATWVETTVTAPRYRLFALATEPVKPGLVRVLDGGVSVEVELFEIGAAAFGDFVWQVSSPMMLGMIELIDGRLVTGFGVEQAALHAAPDISAHGGWRSYLAAREPIPDQLDVPADPC